MPPKYPILILIFLFWAIFQQTFWAHFAFLKIPLNWVMVVSFLIFVLNKTQTQAWFGVWNGLLAGISLDLFSAFPFGIFTVCLAGAGFAVEKLSQTLAKPSIIGFYILFLVYFAVYKLLFFCLTWHFPANTLSLATEFLASAVLASLGLILLQILHTRPSKNRQKVNSCGCLTSA